jgi:cytoskeletal protein RodZ
VITKILHKPAAIAQHVVGGVARRGLHGAVAVIGRILPDDHETPVDAASPKVSTQPVTQPPSPKTTTKKARAERTAAKKATSRPAAPKKPAATLDEDRAPVDADPVVYSSGPDVTTTVPKDDLRP